MATILYRKNCISSLVREDTPEGQNDFIPISQLNTCLKLNFHKSEIFCFGKAKVEDEQYKQLFGCEFDFYPSDIWVYQYIIES
jgi:hypothetical protein